MSETPVLGLFQYRPCSNVWSFRSGPITVLQVMLIEPTNFQRNQQVPLMGQIYSCARSTIIYMGHESDAFKNLFTGDLATRNLDDVLQDVTERPWFTRTWVFQELVLSADPWVQLGRQRIRWREICKLLLPMVPDEAAPRHCGALGPSRKHVLRQMEMVRSSGSNRTLLNILKLRAGCRASDPRDVIFAHLGMITDEKEVSKYLKIDYQTSIRDTYVSVARYVLASFGLAVVARSINRPQGLTHLPSWVPDWGIHTWLGDMPSSTFQDLLAVDEDCRTSVIVTPITNPSHHNIRIAGSRFSWSGPFEYIHCMSAPLPRVSETFLRHMLMKELAEVEQGKYQNFEGPGGFYFSYEFWRPWYQRATFAEEASYIRNLLKMHYDLVGRIGSRAGLGDSVLRVAISMSGYCALVSGDAEFGDIIANCRKEQYGYFLDDRIFGCSGDRESKLLSCLFRPVRWQGANYVEGTIAKMTGHPESQISATHCVLLSVLGETEMHALPLDLTMTPGHINWLIIH